MSEQVDKAARRRSHRRTWYRFTYCRTHGHLLTTLSGSEQLCLNCGQWVVVTPALTNPPAPEASAGVGEGVSHG